MTWQAAAYHVTPKLLPASARPRSFARRPGRNGPSTPSLTLPDGAQCEPLDRQQQLCTIGIVAPAAVKPSARIKKLRRGVINLSSDIRRSPHFASRGTALVRLVPPDR